MTSSSLTDLSEKLQGVECDKMKHSAANTDNRNSAMVAVSCPEKSDCAENMLPNSPAVTECENMVETEGLAKEKLDSGYSWVVVCASFITCFIVGTMFIGFSILYVEISDYFGSSKGVTGWIGSLYMASGNIFGKKCHTLCFIISWL